MECALQTRVDAHETRLHPDRDHGGRADHRPAHARWSASRSFPRSSKSRDQHGAQPRSRCWTTALETYRMDNAQLPDHRAGAGGADQRSPPEATQLPAGRLPAGDAAFRSIRGATSTSTSRPASTTSPAPTISGRSVADGSGGRRRGRRGHRQLVRRRSRGRLSLGEPPCPLRFPAGDPEGCPLAGPLRSGPLAGGLHA